MRKINNIILHCSDTPAKMDIGVKEIDSWHKQKGWNGCGYHYVIRRNGAIEVGRAEGRVGAHTYGYNRTSLGVCLVGRGKYTKSQFEALKELLNKLKSKYTDANINGHYTFSNKTCPMFNVEDWLKSEYYESI